MKELSAGAKEPAKRTIAAYRGYADGHVDFYGNQVKQLTGYSKEELRQLKWVDLIVADDRQKVKEIFVKALKSDRIYTREYRITTKNGDIKWIQEWSEILVDEEGKIDSVVGALIDITHDKIMEEARLEAERLTGKYLIFLVGGGEYGVNILEVKEIIQAMPITPIPDAPECIKGVINLRGKVIPVVDLRRRLGIQEMDTNGRGCIVVVEVSREGEKVLHGMETDAVAGVWFIRGTEVEKPPQFSHSTDTSYILGLAKTERGVNILLDLQHLLGDKGDVLQGAAQRAA